MTRDQRTGPIRLLVVAPHPLRLDDLDVAEEAAIEHARLVRRPKEVPAALADPAPDVVVVATGQHDDAELPIISTVRELAPDAGILALTSDPPVFDHVARAVKAGADGFVDIHATPDELASAMRSVRAGQPWMPAEEMRPLLAEGGGEVETTAAERRSRLTGVMLGLIPLTGILAALLAYLWRRYTGQIGVRPVDIAVDPSSRVIDAIAALSLLLAVFGPLLFIGTWLGLLQNSRFDRGPVSWLLRHRGLAHVTLAVLWLVAAWFLSRGPDALLVLVVGPLTSIGIVARAADLSDELPPLLRIQVAPKKVLIGGLTVLLVFLAGVGGEAVLIGPELGPRGEGGIIVPRIIGFNAQPVEAYNVNTGDPPRELLYLGGNADLYVLVDPCDDNNVEYVSVGAHRLEIIDEITCDATPPP